MYSVRDAATRLNVSERRVRALIASGRLRAQQVGRAWVIEPGALGGVEGERLVGRPLAPDTAWRELLGYEEDPPKPSAAVLRSRFRGRAERHQLTCAQPMNAIEDPQVATGGWQAAMHFDELLDNDPTKPLVAYVGASNFHQWIDRHWLTASKTGRIIALVVPDAIGFSLTEAGPFVPAKVSSVDIAELGGPRNLEAAIRLWSQ
jgi:excisionase family DNA binding protein